MSSWLRPRNIAIAGGIGAAVLFFPRTQKHVAQVNPTGNLFETQGVKNVGDRMSAGGGTSTHTPGVATQRGSAQNQSTPGYEQKGAGTEKFNRELADQKPQEPGAASKAFHRAHLGTDKGK